MSYEQFANAVKAAGLIPRRCNPLHWQIRGGKFIVNFYPDTRCGSRYYVNCTAHGASGDVSEAVQSALGEFRLQPTPKANRRSRCQRRKRKKRLMRQKPFCHYCGVPLTMQTATLDHWIPTSKGGGDFDQNYRLSCGPCNSNKSNKLPHELAPQENRR